MRFCIAAASLLLTISACSSEEASDVSPVSAETIVVTQGQIEQAQRQIAVVRSAAQMYRLDKPSACPTAATLRAEGFVDAKAESDPWGHPLAISCEGNSVTVIVPGPDGKVGTADDIR